MGVAGAERPLHVEQDVLGLDVAVDDPGGVRGGEAVGDVRDDGDGGLGGQPAFAVEPGAQVGAPDQVHDEGEVVAVHHEVADGDDVRVVEPEQRGALLDEPADELWSDARSSRSSLMATGPSGPSPSHTVPALPRPSIWWAVYRLPIFRAKTAPSAAGDGPNNPRSTKLRGDRGPACRGWRQPSLLWAKCLGIGPRKSI